MTTFWGKLQSAFGVKKKADNVLHQTSNTAPKQPLLVSKRSLQEKVILIVERELRDRVLIDSSKETGKNIGYAQALSGYHKVICKNTVMQLDRHTLEAIVHASDNPEYRVTKLLIINNRSVSLDSPSRAYIHNVSLFFDFFYEIGIQGDDFPTALHTLGQMHGSWDMEELRKEKDNYLRALLLIFVSLPHTHTRAGRIHPALKRAIKDEPRTALSVIDFSRQRDIPVKDIDPDLLLESLTTSSPSLREGVL